MRMTLLISAVILTALGLMFSTVKAHGCTGLYVGKKVSRTGSTIVARSEDQANGAYNKMFKVRPGIVEAGRTYVDTGDGQENFAVKLPEETYKYTYIPDAYDAGDGEYPACAMNEYGVTVVATVTADAKPEYLELDPYVKPGIREAIFAGLIAGQCRSAREAVEVTGKLLDEYGSAEGNINFYVDQKEAWIFEIYGGHGYAAMKMPEDKVAVFGNNFMIETVDRDDAENYFFSENLFETIDKLGAYMEGGKYNLVKSISAIPREEYSNMRTWVGHKILAPSTVGEYSNDIFYPLFYTPEEKVDVETVMDIYRNRYEGTPYDMSQPENRGRRPIGVTRQGEVHIVETYDDLPADSCHLQWLAVGNAEHNVFIPAFGGITETHKAYHVDGSRFAKDSMYYAVQRIGGIAESDRKFLSKGTKEFWKIQEKLMIKDMHEAIPEVKKAYEKGIDEGRAFVTELADKYAEKQFNNSEILFNDLFWTATANHDDRADDAKKAYFTAHAPVTEWVKSRGYSIEREGITTTIEKDNRKYTMNENDKNVTLVKDGETAEIALAFAPVIIDDELYAPADFLLTL